MVRVPVQLCKHITSGMRRKYNKVLLNQELLYVSVKCKLFVAGVSIKNKKVLIHKYIYIHEVLYLHYAEICRSN